MSADFGLKLNHILNGIAKGLPLERACASANFHQRYIWGMLASSRKNESRFLVRWPAMDGEPIWFHIAVDLARDTYQRSLLNDLIATEAKLWKLDDAAIAIWGSDVDGAAQLGGLLDFPFAHGPDGRRVPANVARLPVYHRDYQAPQAPQIAARSPLVVRTTKAAPVPQRAPTPSPPARPAIPARPSFSNGRPDSDPFEGVGAGHPGRGAFSVRI